MPKKLDYDNPVRLLREALELTQPHFAKQLGISESHLQKIELGKKRVSHELGAVFAFRYGIDPASLTPRGKPRFLNAPQGRLKNDVAESLKRWEKTAKLLEEQNEDNLNTFVLPKIRLLVSAATHRGQGLLVTEAIDRAVMRIAADFGLEGTVNKMIKSPAEGGDGLAWKPYLAYAANTLTIQHGLAFEVQLLTGCRPNQERIE